MIPVRMVQVPVHEVIRVVAMGNGFVAASGAVLVVLGVRPTVVLRSAIGRIGAIDRENVLLDAARGRMVQMAVVQEIDVSLMLDRLVSAVRSMLMVMIVVMVAHVFFLLL